MDIRNFTDTTIRIGDFPSCLDVKAIDGFHSSCGIIALFHSYRMGEDQHFMQIRKRKDNNVFIIMVFKWEEQLEKLPDYVGDVVFDSRDIQQL